MRFELSQDFGNLIMIRIIIKAIFGEVEIIISGENLAPAGRRM